MSLIEFIISESDLVLLYFYSFLCIHTPVLWNKLVDRMNWKLTSLENTPFILEAFICFSQLELENVNVVKVINDMYWEQNQLVDIHSLEKLFFPIQVWW